MEENDVKNAPDFCRKIKTRRKRRKISFGFTSFFVLLENVTKITPEKYVEKSKSLFLDISALMRWNFSLIFATIK